MKTVKVQTRTVGTNFATVADVRDAASGKLLATTSKKPFGMDGAARDAAEALIAAKGWRVAEAD